MRGNLLIPRRAYLFLGGLLPGLILAGCTLAPVLAPTPLVAEPTEEVGLLNYSQLEPNPELAPDQVVKIQMEALRNNDSSDNGIAITFKFASPDNKRVTGPLARFTRMLKNPLYKPMLNHQSARYGPIKISGDMATQRVTVIDADGKAIIYVFTLSKQSGPPCAGCWMTDSVVAEPAKPEDQQQI